MKRLVPFLFIALVSLRAETPKPIASVLQPYVDDKVLAGAVTMVADKDKVVDVTTVGWADIAAKKPMAKDAIFWIASMSKPITATAFMMLVDEGKVSLDDPVEKYLPEFKGQMVVAEKDGEHVLLKKPKHPITVRNVLSHTSGLAFKSAVENPTLDMLPLRVAVLSYAAAPLQFEPDTKYQYANAGINTAARIIEVVSGMSYEDFMQQRLFAPLGMVDTTFWPSEEQEKRIATSYKANEGKTDLEATTVGQLHYPLHERIRQPMPAGGLFSTAADVVKFCQMLLNGGQLNGKRYISEAALKQLQTKQTAEGLNAYSLGYQLNGSAFGHGGAYSTNMSIDPAKGIATVFMVQNAGWRTDEGRKILPAFQKAAADRFAKP
ncbi:serine hydrolase domain-containing protein [Prosthecobacter vanneervenii]|uniref:CubicO group peptidase (Beta-lactamase class C family) n=1 Tax=Prosthecobacter vanneervenii TaxID=48466 RepID=A0A7W7YEJ2_9BACT|nr:serine hydrolase domain-containing protein [Prosthecobacter vanneervenii]MBB5034718.1 CubicO group peptidase (beta-lactamase class C family) [Prosthecobacter vanneervenii]